MSSPESSSNEFDYVIVGGGTPGSPVAARLSEDPDGRVGPVEPQEFGNSYMRHARAKVLGGCSSHNSAIAFWAPRENLDAWAAQGCDGWSADECYAIYRKLETALDGADEAEPPG